MRTICPAILLLVFLQVCCLSAYSQKANTYTIPLKHAITLPDAIDREIINQWNDAVAEEPIAAVLQFYRLPGAAQKQRLAASGIQIINYIGGYAYLVSISKPLSIEALRAAGTRATLSLDPMQKIATGLVSTDQQITVHLSLFPFITTDSAISRLKANGFAAQKAYQNVPVLQVEVPAGTLRKLASFPFIEAIEPLPPAPVALNFHSTATSRANMLQAPTYSLTGEGVMILINELPGYPQDHIDFIDRSVNRSTQATGNYHSTHVHGIAVGGGVVNEQFRGYAPKASFLSSLPFISDIPRFASTYNVDLSNNSYASGGICSPNSSANDIVAMSIDKMAVDFESLINVFSAGNSGTSQCDDGFPLGYNTVYSGAQSAKSVLTVGAIHANGDLAGFSSKGPGRGRRLKPEIVAPGAEIISTVPDNGYGSNNGTSMSSPAVVGGLALLYQRYQQLHGSKPENALMKPLVCNTATDQGNPGPDYAYGFGMMNLNRALQVLQGGRFYKDSVSHQQTKSKTISVPQGMAQIKLMLYWTDPAASPLSNKHLINDLDLKVTAPDGSVIRPLVLDTLPSLVMNAAARGEDHINNIEQVVINTPVAGNYIITVDGYEISIGTDQAFYVVYDLVADGIELTFPAPGEKLAPGDVVNVQWDNWGNKTSTFSLNFSGDNGQSWQLLSANIPAGTTSFNWTVPDAITNQARLQLIRNSDGKISAPNPFRILGVPQMQLSAAQCPGSVAFEWSAIPGATNYEVMRYRNSEMVHAAFTTGTNYVFRNLSTDSTYWVTVRALYNGQAGRRAIALSRKPDNGSCAGAVYNNDLKVDTLVYPLVGRQFTASQLGAEAIQMRIRNLDDDPSAAFTVSYSVNGSAWVSEAVQNNIAANSLLGYRFQTPINFSAAGEYVVRLAVSSPLDQNKGNDTATYTVRSLANHPVSIQAGITEDLEGVAATTYFTSYTGLQGLERFDYDKYFSSQYLRITNQNAQNPTNSFSLFYDQNGGTAPNEQGLTATYNLSLFDTATHAVGLEFTYVHRATGPRSVDSLLIRGSDRDPWILVEDLFANATQTVTRSVYVPVGDHLKANRQNYSSSFQVRWSVDKSNNVILLDNIKLYNAASDVSVVSIDSMLPYNCGLTATPVQVTINNRTKTSVSNLVVKYRVNNGPVVSETIPALPATSSIAYTFTTKADLSAADHYTILAWTDYLQDSYRKNDTAKITIRNQPFIASFPHIEDFEKNNGGWYTNGTNSSWEWGTPSSPRINGAASGSNAWKTNLDGNHNALESSWLYTGCYDFTRLTKPMISMSLALNTDSCSVSALCELMILQYSVDGRNWATMPPRSVYNWPAFIAAKEYNRWHVVTQRPRDTARTIQFRFQFRSDAYNNYEGIGIDDFHVYDSTTLIYDAPVSASAQQKITGQQQWTAFQKDGKLLAAIQSPGQNLGDVQLKTYMHQGSVRNFHGQYYVNRNFVFQSTHAPTDSVLVRLYFTDKEADSLLFARQCPGCTKPVNAYRFGISTYASIQAAELDSSILNNRIGNWNFIPVGKVRIVPFANGYYAEFKTKDLGEFRLSNGGLDGNSDLPLELEMFIAQRSSANAELQWRTKSEINIQRFDIEVATGNEAYTLDRFQKIGEVNSKGRSVVPQAYNFTDVTPSKKGIRYYRLKTIDALGNYTYSQPVPVIFNEELTWQVYPNPSGGKFTLLYQARSGEVLQAVLYNAIGKRIRELQLTANGFVQRTEINLSANAFASGVYFLQIQTSEKSHLLRVVKQ